MNRVYKYGIILLSFIMIVLIINGIFGLTLNGTFAKYSDDKSYKHYLKTKNIYFESDSLNNDYVVINNYNYQNIYFDIYNGNGNYVTNTDVGYTINCSTDNDLYDCVIDDIDDSIDGIFNSKMGCYNGDSIVSMDNNLCINNNYSWDCVINKNRHSIKIVNNGDELVSKVVVHVEFNTSDVYSYKLEGDFVFNITNNVDRDIVKYDVSNDINDMCMIKIDNLYSVNKNINVILNNNYYFINNLFDSDIVVNNSSGYINDISFNIDRDTSRYIYYLSDGICNKNDISIVY